MAVADFDIRVEYLPGKENSLADVLSRIRAADQPLDELLVGAITCSGHRTRGAVEQSDDISQFKRLAPGGEFIRGLKRKHYSV